MKIAVLAEIISRRSGTRAPLEIARAIKAKGHDVTLFGYGFGLENEAINELRQVDIKLEIIKSSRLVTPLLVAVKLRQGGFDIVCFQGSLPFFLGAKLSGLPIIRINYGTQLDPLLDKIFPYQANVFIKIANNFLNQLILAKEKFVIANSTKIIAISTYVQQEINKLYHVSSEVLYLGIPANFKPGLATLKKEIVIISVSRFVPYKGFHRLIMILNRLAKKYPNLRLVLVGSSASRRYLSYLKKMAGDKVKFLLDISDEQLIKAYQRADIYATFDHYLFFGLPVVEAASIGLPTVAINRCAAREVVKHSQTGFLANNDNEFSQYLEKLISNRDLRIKMGQQAQQYVRKFSWTTLADKYQPIFENVKKQKKSLVGWILVGIISLGAVLRLAFLNSHSFWFDEAFSFFLAKLSVNSLITATAADNNPPLYYLLLKAWMAVGEQVWWLRSFSILAGITSIYLIFKVGQKLTNNRTALLASAIFAWSPLQLYFSAETRMYSLAVLETLLLTWFYLKFKSNHKLIDLVLLTITAIAGLYTQYYVVLIILAFNLCFIIDRRNFSRIQKVSWLISQAIICLAFIPWLVYSSQFNHPNCWCFPLTLSLPAVFVSFASGGMGVVTLKDFIVNAPKPAFWAMGILSLLMFLLFLKGLTYARKNITILIWLLFPLLVISSASLIWPVFSPRPLIILSPFYYLLVALGIFGMKNRIKISIIKSLVFLTAVVILFQLIDPFFAGPSIDLGKKYLVQHQEKNEAIFHLSPMSFYPFQYHNQLPVPQYMIGPSPISPATISQIGGQPVSFNKLITSYSQFWLINMPFWVSPNKLFEIKQTINQNMILDKEIFYQGIELYHFKRQ